MFKKIFKKLKNINKENNIELTEDEAKLFDFIYFDADGQKRDFEEVLICIGLTVNKKGIPIDTRDKTRLNAAREIFNKKTFVKKDKLFVSASKKISGFLSKAQWGNAVKSYENTLNHSVLLGLYVSLLESKTDFKYDNNLTYTKDNLVSYSVKARLYSQAEITEEEAGLFDFIYFDADGQKRNFEEVLVCIGLIVNKKGIPIDTRDTPRLNAAREIFNKKTFVKKDKLFVSASKEISGFLSKAQWDNAVKSYKNMLNHSVLLRLYVNLLKSKTDFKCDDNNLNYTRDKLVSYSVQARLCSTSVLDDADKQIIANKYKHITGNKDDNHSRSEYWIKGKQLRKAHEAYEDVEEALIKEMNLFTQEPKVDRLKKLLQTCIEYINCYYNQYGWQSYATTKHLVDYTTTIYYQDKLRIAMDLEERDFTENVKTCLQTIFGAVPLTYNEFLKSIEKYLVGFDYMIQTTRVSELRQLIKQCPENIDFNQKPKFDNVRPGNAIFPKID